MSNDPFSVLGLPARRGLSDDDVRAAWRRIAAATHPDRDDGGNPAAFGRAAAAYAALRTTYGRGEALADLVAYDAGGSRPAVSHRRTGGFTADKRPVSFWGPSSGRHSGRRRLPTLTIEQPGLLAARLVAAGIASVVSFVVAGWSPASIGILTGIVTWLVASRWRRLGGLRWER
jgi:hypothetical protein